MEQENLTVTIASFVCAISEIIPSVNISSTKYLKRNRITTKSFNTDYLKQGSQ